MYWWWKSAKTLRESSGQRFGLITTNSIKQRFNQRLIASCLNQPDTPMSIVWAVPDHPWVDSTDGADVRIAITVARCGVFDGVLHFSNQPCPDEIQSFERIALGRIQANLSVGPDLNTLQVLRSNELLAAEGVKPHGMGFVLEPMPFNRD
jgi:hypothetical protein